MGSDLGLQKRSDSCNCGVKSDGQGKQGCAGHWWAGKTRQDSLTTGGVARANVRALTEKCALASQLQRLRSQRRGLLHQAHEIAQVDEQVGEEDVISGAVKAIGADAREAEAFEL